MAKIWIKNLGEIHDVRIIAVVNTIGSQAPNIETWRVLGNLSPLFAVGAEWRSITEFATRAQAEKFADQLRELMQQVEE